jgi:hypothetical protein
MIKYHVKFTHQYQLPQLYQFPQRDGVNSSSAIQYITETVDAEWEFEELEDVFTFIYTHFNVIGDVKVTQKISSSEEVKS